MSDSIIKIEILKAIKEKTKLSEIQLSKMFSEYRIDVLIPNSIRFALIKAKRELDDIKIPDPIRFDERIDIVKTNPITNWGNDPKHTFERTKIPVFPINFEEISTLLSNKFKLEMEISYLEKIKGIVSYYISDQPDMQTNQNAKRPTKLKRGELKKIIMTTLESSKGRSLKIQKGLTLNHKQLKTLYNLACDLNREKEINMKSFESKLKQIGYSKEQRNPRKSKK
jgi:hypothetical protein